MSAPVSYGHIEAFGWTRHPALDVDDTHCWRAPDGAIVGYDGEMRPRESLWGALPPIRVYYPAAVRMDDGGIVLLFEAAAVGGQQ